MHTYIVKLKDHDGNIVYDECSTYELALRAGAKAYGGTFEIVNAVYFDPNLKKWKLIMEKNWYRVRMTVERIVQADNEDDAIDLAREGFEYSDMNYSDLDVEKV
jgi:hypothetical protein